MSDWKAVVRHVAANIEDFFDAAWHRLTGRLNHDDPLMIQPYIGYGNGERVRLRGRVMADTGITEIDDRDSVWENLLNTYRRFSTSEVPYAQVQATSGATQVAVTADEEGYFIVDLPLDDAKTADEHLVAITLEAVGVTPEDQPPPRARGEAIIPSEAAQFGVISDLDDTVIRSDVLNLLKLARNTFLRNAHTRLPFKGVAAFYQALRAGTGPGRNPMYYVSNSPWNLYDLLTDFFELRGIPPGALFLQDIGLTRDQFFASPSSRHKVDAINEILALQADIPFVLIGDSGQHDPEVYVQIALDQPERITAIYIRDVTGSEERTREIEELAEPVRAAGVPVLLVADTLGAASHAAEHGLIEREMLDHIAAEFDIDSQPANIIEQLLDTENS